MIVRLLHHRLLESLSCYLDSDYCQHMQQCTMPLSDLSKPSDAASPFSAHVAHAGFSLPN